MLFSSRRMIPAAVFCIIAAYFLALYGVSYVTNIDKEGRLLNHVERGASVQENKKDHNNVPGILSLYHYRQRSRSMDKAAIADPAIWTITGVVYFEEKYSSGNCVQITASIDGKTIEDIIPGSVLGLKQKDYRRIDQAIKRQKM